MSATGLFPSEDDFAATRVPPERIVEFDRLMEEGGIEAIVGALLDKAEQSTVAPLTPR